MHTPKRLTANPPYISTDKLTGQSVTVEVSL